MERERLTITLRKDVLKLVDQSIDGAKLRNRSHAIEYYLSQALSAKTLRVVLFVASSGRASYQPGGLGMSARANLAEGSDLRAIFANLVSQGFTDLLLLGPDSTSLQAAVVDAEKAGLSAKTLSLEDDELTSEKLAVALPDEAFILWDSRFTAALDLANLVEYHKTMRGEATAALLPAGTNSPVSMYGQLYGSRIIALTQSSREGGLGLAGVFIIEPAALGSGNRKDLYTEILPQLAATGVLSGFAFVPGKAAVPQLEAVAVRP